MTEIEWALVQLLDGVQRHDLPNMTGLTDNECDRIWAAGKTARAALAKPEPEGPTIEELVEHVCWFADEACLENSSGDIADSCRKLIARYGRPTPQPADGEVAELVADLRGTAAGLESQAYPQTAAQITRAADLLERLSPPQPIPVGERLPGLIEQALIKAECALSDIAEGEAEESEGDPLEWAEKRAADALARIRPVMRQHQIQTSEWPPLPAHALPIPRSENV